MSLIMGIDPGNIQSGYVIADNGYNIVAAGKIPNEELREKLYRIPIIGGSPTIVIECMQSYGMGVGREIFETCYWIGGYREIAKLRGLPVFLYPRPKIFRAITGESKGGDTTLRRALLTRFGGDKRGEPLNLLKGSTDKRSAFAVAVYHLDGARLGEW